jgi:hypothetical protein
MHTSPGINPKKVWVKRIDVRFGPFSRATRPIEAERKIINPKAMIAIRIVRSHPLTGFLVCHIPFRSRPR